MWHSFVNEHATIGLLAERYGRSINWVRKELRAYKSPDVLIEPCEMVAVIDCVFFSRRSGYLVVRDPNMHRNVYVAKIETETADEYRKAKEWMDAMGIRLTAVVLDGKPGVKPIFEGLPVQMCHFHQIGIVTRYLTQSPRLNAGKELRDLVLCLSEVSEKCFVEGLDDWHKRWGKFLDQRTVNPLTKRMRFTHKRLRSAYRSLRKNMPYLFAFQRHPEILIPNTTNSLDGSFTHLKDRLRIHHGMKSDLKHKMALYILLNGLRK